jgi:hypothetical protein
MDRIPPEVVDAPIDLLGIELDLRRDRTGTRLPVRPFSAAADR